MMPKFGVILVLLLAKSLVQGDQEPIFKVVGETLDFGLCFGVDYATVHRINEEEKQLLWNSSNSVAPPDAYKNRIHSSSTDVTGVQIMDLTLSDSGVYISDCWASGYSSGGQTSHLYVCDEEIPSQELVLQNEGAVLDCHSRYSEHDNTSIKWFTQMYSGSKPTLFLDTERSQNLLQEELNNVFKVEDKGLSLYISEDGLKDNQNFICLVMKNGQCMSFRHIQLPESTHEVQYVYYAVEEKAVLTCMSEHQQPKYWNTPFGVIDATTPQSQMYISNSEGTIDLALVIPSITHSHSGVYKCLSTLDTLVAEYDITICSELVEDNVQLQKGEKVTLTCTLTTNESVNILWYRQKDLTEPQLIFDSGDPSIDMPADMIGRAHILSSNSQLTITEFNETDSGIYWCLVLLDSIEEVNNDSYEDEEEEEDNPDDDDEWLEEEESSETCILKKVTKLKFQKNKLRSLNVDPSQSPTTVSVSESDSSQSLHAIIGVVLGIVILGLIVLVVVKMRTKRRALDSRRPVPKARKNDVAVSSPLMSL